MLARHVLVNYAACSYSDCNSIGYLLVELSSYSLGDNAGHVREPQTKA